MRLSALARCLSRLSPQRQQQDHRLGQRHQPGDGYHASRFYTKITAFPADAFSFVTILPIGSVAQGLASLTSTIAPAAGGSIYAYFSSLNKVPTLLPRKSPPVLLRFWRECTRRSHFPAFFFCVAGLAAELQLRVYSHECHSGVTLGHGVEGRARVMLNSTCRPSPPLVFVLRCVVLHDHHSIFSQIDPNLDKRQT